jgi:hypothetical protein
MDEPVLAGLLFADKIITEDNGKKAIIGTFTRFFAQAFPASFPPWAIYAAVTNVAGEHEFALHLFEAESNQMILPLTGKFNVKQKGDLVELTPTIMGAVFPRPGKYTLLFLVDGEQVGARTLLVEAVKER